MKFTFYFNLICYLVVVLAYYQDLIYGAIFQFFLGLIQLTFATIIYQDAKKADNKYNLKLIRIYGYSILIGFILFILLLNFMESGSFYAFFIFVFPMLIALYFVILTFLIRKQ